MLKDFRNINYLYTLGFIWADGSLSKNGNKVDITIKTSDFNNLYDIVSKTGEWKIYHRNKFSKQTNKFYQSSSISICDKEFHNFLIENDYYKKSYVSPDKILSKIQKEYHSHFLRGYIDGDGSFSFYDRNQCKFNVTSSILQDWSSIEKIIKFLDIKSYKIYKYDRKCGKCSLLSISNKNDIIKIGEFIYKDSLNVRLERKFDKYLEIKNSNLFCIRIKWNLEEEKFLLDNYKFGIDFCSKKLNRTTFSIIRKYNRIKNI